MRVNKQMSKGLAIFQQTSVSLPLSSSGIRAWMLKDMVSFNRCFLIQRLKVEGLSAIVWAFSSTLIIYVEWIPEVSETRWPIKS